MAFLADKARELRSRCAVLALALRHSRTPWYAKAVGGLTLLYALSPIDLIPDFIPVLGHLDDLVLVPLGIWATIKLIPGGRLGRLRSGGGARARRSSPGTGGAP